MPALAVFYHRLCVVFYGDGVNSVVMPTEASNYKKWTRAPAFAGVTSMRWGDGLILRHASEGWHPFIKKWTPAFAGVTMSGLG